MARVAALWRHPIKGHGREALGHVTLHAGQAIPGDRRWAVAHEAAQITPGEWAPCVNFSRGSKVAALMGIDAETHNDSGHITLRHPDRPDLTFDPASDEAAFLDWVRPLMPTDRAQSARLVELPGRGHTDTDFPSVSLLNLSSNADLAVLMGQGDISPLRWRCNIHLEGLAPWEEERWIGQELRLGDARLTVREPIVRCLATTANPATGQRDLDTLGALQSNFGHRNFGIYAQVTQGGEVALGDTLEHA